MVERHSAPPSPRREDVLSSAPSKVLAGIAHELRTPVSGISGMVALLEKTGLTVEQRRYVDLVAASAASLRHLVDQLLDFAGLREGSSAPVREPFELKAAIEGAVALLVPEAAEKGLSLTVAVESGLDVWVAGDPFGLRQIVSNLVVNAVKFTERGGIGVAARLDGRSGESILVELAVTDSGIGIPTEKLGPIFDGFTQLEAGARNPRRGLGLGLSIVHEVASRMGGLVEVDSAVGRGSTFTVQLPFRLHPGRKAQASGGSILIAEDEAVNRMYIDALLARNGYRTTIVSSGAEAVEAFGEGRYDLILMDLAMPEVGGAEAARAIRERELVRGGHVPIIALTAYVHREEIDRCLGAGMDAWMTKPFAEDELLERIEALLDRRPCG